jgi:hypothetical protein
MKNLIINKYLECEKELKININLSVEDVMFIKGKMEAYMSILQSLQDYNLITAPKQIKLSEIVKRLNDCDKTNKFKVIIQVGETTVVENTEFKKEYFYIKNNKMFDLSDYMVRDEYKFLYELWIAGTIIEDDVESDE